MENVGTLAGLILAAIYGAFAVLAIWLIWQILKMILLGISIPFEEKFPKFSEWLEYLTMNEEEKEFEKRHKEFMKTHPRINN